MGRWGSRESGSLGLDRCGWWLLGRLRFYSRVTGFIGLLDFLRFGFLFLLCLLLGKKGVVGRGSASRGPPWIIDRRGVGRGNLGVREFGNGRPLVNRARIVHRDDDEWCLQAGRRRQNGRGTIRLDKRSSEPRNNKGKWMYLRRRGIYRLRVVYRNDRSGSDSRYQRGALSINVRRGFLLVDDGGLVLDRFLRFSGDLDTTLFDRLRSGGRDILLFLDGDGSRDRSDYRFLCSRFFVTGRVNFLRFRRRIIDIIDVSSPIGLGGSLVDSSPPAIDDELVQDLFRPGNTDGSRESALPLVETNGTGPLLDKKFLRICKAGRVRERNF